MVYDGTSCITILLWDTYVIQLCGKTAEEVSKEDTEEFGYPPTLENLIERRLLFKLKVRANNVERNDRVYTLAAMCEDEDLVKKYLPEENKSQSTTTAVEMGASNSIEVSPVVYKLQPDSGDNINVVVGDDSVSTKTPGKRPASLMSGDSSAVIEKQEGQLSTNKFSRRVPRKGVARMIEDDN